MKFFKIFFLVLFLNTSSYAVSKIVLSSLSTKPLAEKSLQKILPLLQANKNITTLGSAHNLYLGIRKSSNYYMVVIEQFTDHDHLLLMLNEVKPISPNAYYSRIKLSNILEKKVSFTPKSKIVVENKTNVTQEVKQKVIVKNESKVIEVTDDSLEVFSYKNYIIYTLLIIGTGVFVFYWLFRQKNAEDEEIEEKEVIPSVDLDTVDVEKGLNNFIHKQSFYNQEIDSFVDKYTDAKSILENLIDTKNYDDAKKYLQEMKTSSQKLGALKLPKSLLEVKINIKELLSMEDTIVFDTFNKDLELFLIDIKNYRQRSFLD